MQRRLVDDLRTTELKCLTIGLFQSKAAVVATHYGTVLSDLQSSYIAAIVTNVSARPVQPSC